MISQVTIFIRMTIFNEGFELKKYPHSCEHENFANAILKIILQCAA